MRSMPTIATMLFFCAAAPLSAQGLADAYRDAEAREMVRLARERRLLTDTRIREYRTTAMERVSVGLDAGLVEKLVYRRETASRIHWTHDTVRIDLLGAREVVPLMARNVQVPNGLAGSMPALAFDPVNSEMVLRLDSTDIRHPLAADSEEHYRFSSGDSTVISLPDGRKVRLRELRIEPRRRDRELMTGSFWLDRETHAVVQAYFRLARPWSSDDDGGRIPFVGELRAELDYIAVEYGLWDLRWWLPRTVAARGVASAGRFRAPVEFNRTYRNYEVVGDTAAAPPGPGVVSALDVPTCRPRTSFTIGVNLGSGDGSDADVRADSALARAQVRRQQVRDSMYAEPNRLNADSLGVADWKAVGCDRVFIVQRAEGARLLESPYLPGSIYGDDTPAAVPSELEAIARRVRDLPMPPWMWEAPRLQLPWNGGDLFRYNRVEGASVGGRLLASAGRFTATVEARLATAPMEPYGALGLRHDSRLFRTTVRGYHDLNVASIANQPFGFASTAAALILGRDDNDYFRATGAEFTLAPAPTRAQWYEIRLFGEAQRPVAQETDFSLFHSLGGDDDFRPNLAAARADQFGAALRLRTAGRVPGTRLRWGTELSVLGESGDFDLGHGAVTVRGDAPLGRFALGVEATAGGSTGDLTPQRGWQLGGVSSLRGYGGAALRGESFWRGRLELGTGLPLVRLSGFMDVGWAGERDAFAAGRPLRSAGFGLGVLDGLVRLDFARALDRHRSWRLHLHTTGVL